MPVALAPPETEMLTNVLAKECARLKVETGSELGCYLNKTILYAYSMGMREAPELDVFIRNLKH